MAELVGTVAAATQLAQLGLEIVDLIRRVREAPRLVTQRAAQVRQLIDLAALVQRNPRLHTVPVLDATLRDCLQDAEALREMLAALTPADDAGRATRAWKALDGVAKERRVGDLCQRLEERKSMLSLCITSVDSELLNSMGADLGVVRDGVDRMIGDVPAIREALERLAVAEDRPAELVSQGLEDACRASLGFPGKRQLPQPTASIEINAYSWFFETGAFKSWVAGTSSSTLLVNANPGCGKTTLASRSVSRLEESRDCHHDDVALSEKSSNVVISFFFNAANQDAAGTANACLKSLIAQLVDHVPSLFPILLQDYKSIASIGTPAWAWQSLSTVLSSMVAATNSASSVFLILDALDECESSSRTVFLQHLQSLIQNQAAKGRVMLKILATCRPNDDIAFDLNPTLCFTINESNTRSDLLLYIKNGVKHLSKRRKLDDQIGRTLLGFFEHNAQGMFLWVNLVLEELSRRDQRLTDETIASKLAKIPLSLKNIYNAVLEDAPLDRRRDLWQILRLLVYSRRTLGLDELRVALSIENNLSRWYDLEGDVQYLCGCLICIDNNEIRWVHQTALDQVVEHASDATHDTGGISMDPTIAELHLMELCVEAMMHYDKGSRFEDPLRHVDHCSIHEYRQTMKNYFESRPFLAYAGRYWSAHANSTNELDSALVSRIALLLDSGSRRDALMRLNYHFVHLASLGCPSGASALHLAAYFDLPELVKRYLTDGMDANIRAGMDDTPLVWASEVGNLQCVNDLLWLGHADPNLCELDGWTPLHWAAANGHADVAAALLSAGARMSANLDRQESPLWWAMSRGHHTMVSLLLEWMKLRGPPSTNAVNDNLEHPEIARNGLARLDVGRYTMEQGSSRPISDAVPGLKEGKTGTYLRPCFSNCTRPAHEAHQNPQTSVLDESVSITPEALVRLGGTWQHTLYRSSFSLRPSLEAVDRPSRNV